MKREIVSSLVVSLLVGCGSGSSSGGVEDGVKNRGFVDSLIENMLQGKELPDREDLSGLWLSVGERRGTQPKNCDGTEQSAYDGKYFELVHISDDGDSLNVSYCDSDYSWTLLIDVNNNVHKEYRGTALIGSLIDNNTIDFGTESYFEVETEICPGTYEGVLSEQLIKLSNDTDVPVGKINIDSVNEDISCAYYELEARVDEEGNRKEHSYLGLNPLPKSIEMKYSYHLDKGEFHLGDNEGVIEISGKVVNVRPSDGEDVIFTFD